MSGQPQKKRPNPTQGNQQPKKAKQEEKKQPQQQKKQPQQQQKKPQQKEQKKPQEKKAAPAPKKEEPKEEEEGDEDLLGISSEVVEKLNEVEDSLQNVHTKIVRAVRKLELSHDKERKALYAKRDQLVKDVPEFWMKVFLGQPELRDMLQPADMEIASHLASVVVENLPAHADGTDAGFKIVFTFKAGNPLVESKTVQKEYKLAQVPEETPLEDDSNVTITSTDIKFKNKKFVDENKESFFINWFTSGDQEADLQLGQIFRDDIYPQSWSLFMSSFEDDEDDMSDDDDLAGNLASLQEEEDGEEQAGDD